MLSLTVATAAFAADPEIFWSEAKDLNLDNLANWKKLSDSSPAEKFPADAIAYLASMPSGDLTISTSAFSLYRFWMKQLTGGVTFDLGSREKTFTASNRMFVENGSDVRIKRGTVGVALSGGDRFFIGDSTANNLLAATGSDAKLVAATLQVGTSANGNTVRIADGATAQANTVFVGRKAARDNAVVVSGVDSTLTAGLIYLGNGEDSSASVQNGLVVSNGGCVAAATCTVLGNYMSTSRANYLEIGKDGSFATAGYAFVGNNGCSNEIRVVDGGVLSMTNNNLTIGVSATARGNAVSVGSGGELCLRRTSSGNSDLYVGSYGSDNLLRFDGGDLSRGADSESVRIVLGQYAGANGNRLEVLNGSSVDVSRLIVGDQGSDAKLLLSNATIRVKGDGRCQLSANAGHTGNDLVICGTSARLTARQLQMGGDSKLVFNMPTEGFDGVPVQLDESIFLTNGETPEIVVNLPNHRRKGGWHTLLRVGSAYNLRDCLAGFTITTPPGVRVSVEKTELKVRYSANVGLIVIFR